MCGRYGFIPGSKKQFQERFRIDRVNFELKPRYNVAPGQIMPVITRNSPNKAEEMKWGLVPFWAKDPKIGYKMINARAETVAIKPSFRRSLMKQRCLIPVSGFYEWKKTDNTKIPYYIHLKNAELFSFAGLYDVWKDAEGKELKSYTIITTEPNTLMAEIHNRMPAILSETTEETWLDPANQNLSQLVGLLNPYMTIDMSANPVSKLVNNPENDSPEILKIEE